MKRREFLKAAGVGMMALGGVAQNIKATEAKKRPNFIFFLTDDMGWGDARAFGHPYVKTPNLDRLCAEGTRFTQFYVANPVCSPSRTAFTTSHYPARHLVHGHFADNATNAARFMPNWLDPKAPTLPRLLKEGGYTTAHFGKWHLGSGQGAPAPDAYGFDVYKTVNANGPQLGEEEAREYLKSQGQDASSMRNPEGQLPYFRAKSTRMIVDETLKFVKEHKDGPFYVNAWTLVPHAHLDPTPEQLAVYADLQPEAMNPGFGKWFQKYLGNASDLKSQLQIFLASLTDMDTQLGRLLDGLKEMGLEENTVIFFSSDNGPEDYRIGNAANAGVGSPGEHRGRKRSIYEGGVCQPCVVRWPGKIAAGRLDKEVVLGSVDFLPSVCALAGVTVPAEVKPDGEDVSDIWLGAARARKGPLYWEWLFEVWGPDYAPPRLAIRDGKWKLLLNPDKSRIELYDIPADQQELKNVAAENPKVVEELAAKLLAWQKTLPPSEQREYVPRSVGQANGAPGPNVNAQKAQKGARKGGPGKAGQAKAGKGKKK